MIVKAYGEEHITTYLITLNNRKILLDFNCNNISFDDISQVDYVFLTHEHLDHIETLLNFDLVSKMKESVRLFSSKTTKELIQYIVKNKISKLGYNTKKANAIINLVDSIEVIYFNEKMELDNNISFYLYRSGHTFGSSSVHLIGECSLLYTGDIDFVKNDNDRQYAYPYNMSIDYLIADGTKLFADDYKGVSVNRIVEYIRRKKKITEFKYNVRPEKAVLYAKSLAEKLDDFVFFYGQQMGWYLDIVTSNAYNPYVLNKVMYPLSFNEPENFEKKIMFVHDNKSYNLDMSLSLHITKQEFIKIINDHICNEPKILIGHYDMQKQNENIEGLSNYQILTKGENEIG